VNVSVVVAAYEHDAPVILTSDIGGIEGLVNSCGAEIHMM
jgi:hypothetical protein